MSSPIHQLYCTHCTYGSSYLHQREGALGKQVFEYSARAGSVPREQSHDYFRRIEPYLHYRLPADTPADLMTRLSAATTPRRLVYLPSVSGLRVVAHVAYRTTDTQGRAGSYFAHVLFGDEAQADWSAVDALRLWGASGWQVEDAAFPSLSLPILDSLDEFLAGLRPAVGDVVLLSFLTTAASGEFDDPGSVIPERWRRKPTEERQQFAAKCLRGFLALDTAKRQSLLLAVEPSVAALAFYAVARLLPRGELAESIGFSTLESHVARPTTNLAAVLFHDPLRNDLPRDAYAGRGLAINTFNGRESDLFRSVREGDYAATVVSRLAEQGWSEVDGLLRDARDVGATSAADLEQVAEAERLVPRILSVDGRWQIPAKGPRFVAPYVRRSVARAISSGGRDAESVESVMGTAGHLPLLELLAAGDPLPRATAAMSRLTETLPEGGLGRVIALPAVPAELKADLLTRHILSRGALPSECGFVWEKLAGRDDGVTAMMSRVVARLDAEALRGLAGQVPAGALAAYAGLVLAAAEGNPPVREALPPLVEAMDDDALCGLLRSPERAAVFFRVFPRPGAAALSRRLFRLVDGLPHDPARLSSRLEVLVANRMRFPEPKRQQIVAWHEVRRQLRPMAESAPARAGVLGWGGGPDEAQLGAARALVESLERAMPELARPGAETYGQLVTLFRGLAGSPGAGPDAFDAVWEPAKRILLPRLVGAMDDATFLQLLGGPDGAALLRDYPADDPLLGQKLQRILQRLPNEPSQFGTLVDVLAGVRNALPKGLARQVDGWKTIRDVLIEVRGLRQRQPTLFDLSYDAPAASELVKRGELLGRGIAAAMPEVTAGDWETRRDVVTALSRELFGDDSFGRPGALFVGFIRTIKKA